MIIRRDQGEVMPRGIITKAPGITLGAVGIRGGSGVSAIIFITGKTSSLQRRKCVEAAGAGNSAET